MKLSSKVTIHPVTVFFILAGFLSGYFKYIVLIILVVSIHEAGHYIVARIFKRDVGEVILLPFGGLLKMDSLVSSDIFEDLLISISGIGAQTILGFLILGLREVGLLDEATFTFLNSYNRTIIMFNLIPISPLDGYKMMKYSFEFFLPFKKTFTVACSIGTLVFLSLFLIDYHMILDNALVFSFLMMSMVQEIGHKRFWMMRFYFERMSRRFNYPLKEIKDYSRMYKNKVHSIKGIREDIYLSRVFTEK